LGESSAESDGGVSNRRKVKKQPDWIAVYRMTFKSAAWQVLSVGARAVFVELAANYNTRMENAVYLSARTGAKRLGVDKKMTVKWLRELQHYGFIALVERGTIGVYGYGKATQYRLTDRPHAGKPPTHDFQNWTGEVFNPEPDGGRNWRSKKSGQKQNPVPQEGTPRTPGRYIEKADQPNSLCTPGRDIETASACTPGRYITSLASSEALNADAAGPSPPEHAPIGHNAGPALEPDSDAKIDRRNELKQIMDRLTGGAR
jgi:hypothetical protein